LIRSPTQGPEARGSAGEHMKRINSPDFILWGDGMFWWFIGGMFVGALLSLFFLAICNACLKETIDDEKERNDT